MSAVFSLQYIGSISYWAALLQADDLIFDVHEHFRKQSYHNRCRIFTANGLLNLSIPTSGGNYHRPLQEIRINYAEAWQRVHMHAIRSAYGSSPFFPYYADSLEKIYTQKPDSLPAFQLSLLELIGNKFLKAGLSFSLSEAYVQEKNHRDYRTHFHPKTKLYAMPAYRQVFSDRHPFVSDLCIIDLLFQQGPRSLDYLSKVTITS